MAPALIAFAMLLVACGSSSATVDTAQDFVPEPAEVDQGPEEEPGMIDDEVVDVGGAPRAIDIDLLTSGSWNLRFGGGPEGDVMLVDGFPVTITFDGDGSFGGTAACNDYGGTYGIEGNEVFFAEVGKNDAGCETDVQAAESAFIAALGDVTEIHLSPGQLVLGGFSTELIFESASAVPIEELWGRSFVLEATLIDGVPTPAAGEELFLAISPNNTIDGFTGCRTFAGSFVPFGSEIVFNELRADGECPASLADQDGHILEVFEGGVSVEFDGGQLLLSSAGNVGLQYRDTTSDGIIDAADAVEDDADAPPDAVESDEQALLGTVWVFAGGDSPDGEIADPRTIDPDALITITFTDGGYSGRAVCNGYGASADIGLSLASVSFGVPEGEEEGCGEGLDDIISVYLSALPTMVEGGFDSNGLVLNDGDATELWFELAS